jgi:hypothetical protein
MIPGLPVRQLERNRRVTWFVEMRLRAKRSRAASRVASRHGENDPVSRIEKSDTEGFD